MAVYEFEGKKPVIVRNAFVYPEATIIGDVTIAEGCYIGPGARIRGDWGKIIIGPHSNIQENVVIHSAPGVVTILAEKSHIGHGAILHDVILDEHVVIGMGAIIMRGVKIGAGSCIGAGALVKEGEVIDAGELYVGVPAKKIGKVTEKMKESLERGTGYYIGLPPRCFNGLRQLCMEQVLNVTKK